MRIEAATIVELLGQLEGSGRLVPPRGPNRNKGQRHTEAWTTFRLLATLASADRLDFPLACEIAEDKPDLRLYWPTLSVGIEITEMVSQNYAQAVAIANQYFDEAFIEPSLFPWGAPKLEAAEIRKILDNTQSGLTGKPVFGDAPEREWATAVRDTVVAKLKKINAPGYTFFPTYWLAIYDNLPLPQLDRQVAANLVMPLLDAVAVPLFARSFSRLLVESGTMLISIQQSGMEFLPIAEVA